VLPGTLATDRTRTAPAISRHPQGLAAEKIGPPRVRSACRDGSTRSARSPTTSTNGKASTKALRHDPYWASMPPTKGPTMAIGHTLEPARAPGAKLVREQDGNQRGRDRRQQTAGKA